MDSLFEQIGATVDGVLASAPVQLLVLGFASYVAVVWLAAAHWVLRDMRRRRSDATTPYLAALAVVLLSPVLLPVSIFTYLVLRPSETLAERRERELSERLEALDADRTLACPGCRLQVEEEWLVCPACRTQLSRRCRGCSRPMGLDWRLCGWCGAEFGGEVRPQGPEDRAWASVGTERSRPAGPEQLLRPGA